MTPAARLQAAIETVDEIGAGLPAEKALTNWARRSRFAGSGDRAAVRDLVYDTLRRWRSTAAVGGGISGRARLLGLLRQNGMDAEMLFSGARHAPAPLDPAEQGAGRQPEPGPEALDLPDWIWPEWVRSLGEGAERAAEALRHRAPVFLRVNLTKDTVEAARRILGRDGIETEPVPLAPTALQVVRGARRVAQSTGYRDGLIEVQDAASQAVVASLPLRVGAHALDYCAGGGGKALAMAARGARVTAHDAAPRRMADLPARAARGGHDIAIAEAPPQSRFDLVLCDVPCSGTGAWRRSPDAKWRLSAEDLAETRVVQAEILDRAAPLVREGGVLAYATCSVLQCENSDQIDAFLARTPGWECRNLRHFLFDSGSDGFFAAQLSRI